MSSRSAVLRSIIWNWSGMLCDAASAFLVMPFLIHRLGEGNYGTWVLIGSMSSYFGMLDLGVRGSVGRFIAYHKARGDREALNATLSTSFLMVCIAGLITLLACLGLPWLFSCLFEIPSDQAGAVRVALLLIGVNIATSFPLLLFDGVLWGYQRFDVINAIEVPTALVRTMLTFVIVGRGYGLVGLAAMTLVLALPVGVAKGVMSVIEDPGLRIRFSCVTRESARELLSYGVSNLLINLSRMVRGQVSPGLIGSLVSLPAVTVYAVSRRFLSYTERVIQAATGVMTPITTALHASGGHERQRELFLTGGRYCTALTFFFCGGLILLGKPLILLWLGPRMTESSTLLTILTMGEALPLSQSVSTTLLLGVARHRVMAWFGFAEVFLGVVLAYLLVGNHGLAGIGVSIAVSGAVCRGLAVLLQCCRLMNVPPGVYARETLFPPLLVALSVMAATALVLRFVPIVGWLGFLGISLLYTTMFCTSSLLTVKPEHRQLLLLGLRRRMFSTERP